MTARKRKRRATAVERTVIESLGGRRTFNSGAGDEKADGRVRPSYDAAGRTSAVAIRMENKTTSTAAYRLRGVDWHDLWVAAVGAGEIPVFHIQLCTFTAPLDLVVIPIAWGSELLGVKTKCSSYQSTYGVSLQSWSDRVSPEFNVFGLETVTPQRTKKRYDLMICRLRVVEEAVQQ